MKNVAVRDLFFGFGCVMATVEEWRHFHRHDEIQFGFYENGPVGYQLGGQVHRVMPDECVLFWGAIPHQLQYSPPNNMQYWITIPLDLFISWDLPESFTHAVLNGKLLKSDHTKLREWDKQTFKVWKDDFGSNEKEYLSVVASGVCARIKRFSLQSKEDHKSAKKITAENRTLFATIYDYIAKNFYHDISIEDIAAHAGVHPNYAMNAFKKSCGHSIGKLITMMRIYEAQRLLTTTDMKILDIAMESGFGSLSSFYSSFKKHCGKSPKEYRKGTT